MDVRETRLIVFNRAEWKCEVCHILLIGAMPQIAHQIPQKKHYIKKYGKAIIHHHLNLKACCGLKCNSKIDINGKTMQIEKLVEEIKKDLQYD